MKHPFKTLMKVAAALVVLVIIGLVVVVLSINSIARKGVEIGATKALGVNTTLASAHVGLMSGTFGMSGLNVAEPAGFTGPAFMTLGDGNLAVSLSSLMSDTVEVPSLTLKDLSLSLEKKDGKANYQVIMDNLAKFSGSGSKSPAPANPPASDSGKKFVITEVVLTNVKVHLDIASIPGADIVGKVPVVGGAVNKVGETASNVAKTDLTIPEIRLHDVGKSGVGNSGATMGELTAIITKAVFQAVVDKAGDLLPADVMGDLKGGLSSLGNLGNFKMDSVIGGVGDVAKVGEKVGDVGKKAADEGKKAVDNIGSGIKGILGGGDKKDEKKDDKK